MQSDVRIHDTTQAIARVPLDPMQIAGNVLIALFVAVGQGAIHRTQAISEFRMNLFPHHVLKQDCMAITQVKLNWSHAQFPPFLR